MKKRSSQKIPVLVIFAPTASGKTALMYDLFSHKGSHFFLTAEVISADSMQVYKYMDIGTAKPDKEFCSEIPHHLIDITTPDIQFNVSDFLTMADEKCREIYERGKLPVVCGGTGFYIRSFLYGLPKTPESDVSLRNNLKERIKKEGNVALYNELKQIDPESASKIHINDEYRILRALEVYYLTGKTRSSYKIEQKIRDDFDFTFIVLEPPRDLLYSRIRERVDIMFESGLKQEIENLKNLGYNEDCPGMKAIGYHEWFEYDEEEKIREAIKHNSQKYAKKQYTYVRDIPGSIKIDYQAKKEDVEKVRKALDQNLTFCDNTNTL